MKSIFDNLTVFALPYERAERTRPITMFGGPSGGKVHEVDRTIRLTWLFDLDARPLDLACRVDCPPAGSPTIIETTA